MSEINIKVKMSNNTTHDINISIEEKISKIKQMLLEKTEIPIEQQKLIYAGKVLKDPEIIKDCKLADGHTIHLVKGSKPKGFILF